MQKVYKYLPKSGLVYYNCQLQLMMNWNTGTAELGGARAPPLFAADAVSNGVPRP